MKTPPTAIALTVASLLIIGLSACNSGSDEAAPHDHSAHEGAAMAPEADGHEGHDHGAEGKPAMDMAGDAAMSMGLKKIQPSADYPLTTCVVSGEPLGGDMGAVIAYEYDGQEVQFCCAGCVDEFKESPAEFVAKVREAGSR